MEFNILFIGQSRTRRKEEEEKKMMVYSICTVKKEKGQSKKKGAETDAKLTISEHILSEKKKRTY
jgi:hypothetical protein